MISFFRKPNFGPATDLKTTELVERLRWVIGIRWTVVVALLVVGILGTLGKGLVGSSVQTAWVYLGLALLVSFYNLLYLFLINRPAFGQASSTKLIRYAQIPVDLLVFTAIMHFSAGVTGPVFVLYFLYIFVGLAILPPIGAYFVAGIAALCYGALALFELYVQPAPQNPNPIPAGATNGEVLPYLGYFLTVSATLLITAYIARYFSGLLTRDERTIRQQLGEINALYTFSKTISATLSSEDVLQTLVDSAVRLELADAGAVLLFNDRGEGVMTAAYGFTPQQVALFRSRAYSADHPVVKGVVAEGRGIFAPDPNAVPDLSGALVRESTRSFYAMPIMNDERLTGILTLSFDRYYRMPGNHWNLLNAMAQQAALAIERTRLFGDAQRAAKEMTGLYYIGLATTSSLQIDEVLHLIYEQVNRVVHPDTFYIALYDEDLAELRFDMFIEGGQALPPFRSRMENVGISGWVVRNRKPVFVRHWDRELEQLPFETSVVGSPTQSAINVPLIAKNKIVGVMSAQALSPYAFDQNHLRLLTSIASQAALALENARLHAQVNEQAQRDPLTGVYHHGAFIERLNSSLARAHTDRQTVACIMLDIDRFKRYNDTYGHLVGDDVLRSTVASIQSHVKGTDVVGRWGGEEFGIVLQDVNRAQARLVAERIRQSVACNVMKDMHGRSIPSPTVSQGIAMFPEDATDIEELIDKADSALFKAKDRGRNQIVEWVEMLTALSG